MGLITAVVVVAAAVHDNAIGTAVLNKLAPAGTNHLGLFALVAHLLPLLRAGHARVTSQLSIAAHRTASTGGTWAGNASTTA